MSHIYKDCALDAIDESFIGKSVRLAGFVMNIRDHGGVKFLDLRDMYEVVQVVVHDESMLEKVHRECSVTVHGTIVKRDEETINEKIKSGTVELKCDELEVLGQSQESLPFELNNTRDIKEEVRLKYRYLDLRSARMRDNIILRSKVISYMRQKMDEMGFLEMQTPILSASSPEGARDYLIPSRRYHGKFYALPQAPQIFKQILMVSGFDKYYQVAPCFRDEDARADRSPGEFYQLDFEMSFATQDDVLEVAEKLLYDVFTKFSSKKVTEAPFPRISYKESMLKYGTDKPDLRNPLEIIDLSDFFKKCTFKPFIDKTVRAIKVHGHMSKGFHEKMLSFAKSIGMGGLGYLEVQEDLSYKGPIDKFIPDELKEEMRTLASLEKEDTIFFIADDEKQASKLAGEIRTELANRLNLIDDSEFKMCFIVDFPMYELDEDTGKPIFTHNPFSMPQGGLKALEAEDKESILAYQYDIVVNGVELSSGAVRNHDINIMKKAFEIAGYSEDDLKQKFGALYNAFQYGAPPHAGMAPGIDRIIMLLTDESSIREIIAFPLNSEGRDLMLGSPTEVSEQQLREVHIKIR